MRRLGSRAVWLTAAAGGALALHGILWTIERWPAPRALWGDEIMYLDVARRLAAGEPVSTDILWPPGYAHFLAAFLAGGDVALVLARGVQLAALGLAAVLLYEIVARVTASQLAAAVAAALFVLDPQVGAFAHYLWPEILHITLLLSVLWILISHGERPIWLALVGVALGCALLMKSLLGPFIPVLLAPLVSGLGWRRGSIAAALVLLPMFAVVAPTMLANARRGVPVIADSSRFNLWVGLNDRSRTDLVDDISGAEYERYVHSGRTPSERNRVLEERIAGLIRERGWLDVLSAQLGRQYFRLFDKDSFLTHQLPDGLIAGRGFGYRQTSPAITSGLRAWSYALHAVVLAGGVLGVPILIRRGAWGRVLVAFLAYNAALFLLLHVKSRYRIAFLPFLCAGAGAFSAWCVERPTAAGPPALSWAVAAVAAGLALLLAFGG